MNALEHSVLIKIFLGCFKVLVCPGVIDTRLHETI